MQPAEVDIKEIVQHARIALEHGGDDAEVIAYAGYLFGTPGGDLHGAVALTEKALSLNPNSVVALTMSGLMHAHVGNTGLAIERVMRAARLNPLEGDGFRNNILSIAYLYAGQYEAAIEFARKALLDRPNYVAPMRRQAALLGLLGRIGEARDVVQRLRTISPDMTISRVRAYLAVGAPPEAQISHFHDAICEGLRLAGLPE